MVFGKKVIIWDMDNTLYPKTDVFSDTLDEAMAIALVVDLGVKLSINDAKSVVKQSFKIYRDGGQIFYDQYGIKPEDLFFAYHARIPVEKIVPCDGLLERLKNLPVEQYVFTYCTDDTAKKTLKQIGLYDFFKDKLYTVERYNLAKKNDNVDVYLKLCEDIGVDPQDCIFVDDSYSNLEFAKMAGMMTVRLFYNDNSSKDKPYIDAAYKGISSFLDAVYEGKFN